jgi:hypothetical protein
MRIAWDVGAVQAASFSGISDASAKHSWPSFASSQASDRHERGGSRADCARTVAVRRAIERMLESLTVAREARAGAMNVDRLAQSFNALLQQVKESFPDAAGLRLIEPVAPDGSVAVIAVRLFLLKRTIDADLEHPPRPADRTVQLDRPHGSSRA